MSGWKNAFEQHGNFTSLDGARRLYRVAVFALNQIALPIDQEAVPHSTPLGPVPVVFAAAALEAFLFDLTELPGYGNTSMQPMPPEIKTLGVVLDKISSSSNIALKYELARTILSSTPFDRGASTYQDFDSLIRLRNFVVHSRPLTSSSNAFAKLMDRLSERGLIKPPPNMNPHDGLIVSPSVVFTSNVAAWACSTVPRFTRTLFEDPRSDSLKHFDGARLVESWFPSASSLGTSSVGRA